MLVCDSLEPFSKGRWMLGRHGKAIAQQLHRMGLRLEDFSVGCAAACAPAPRHLSRAAATCSQLDTLIAQRSPRVLVALDPLSFQRLTGIKAPQLVVRGWVYPGVGAAHGRWVVPTLAVGGQQRGLTLEANNGMWLTWRADVAKALRVAEEGYAYEQPDIFWRPSLREWDGYVREFLADPSRPLACDTEFPWKRKADMSEEEKKQALDLTNRIDEVNFAYEVGRGGSVPWAEPYIEGALAMLHASQQHGVTLFWNTQADAPRLTASGGPVFTAQHTEDLMDTFRVWRNSASRRLACAASLWPSMHHAAPWKHLGTDDPYYRGMDAIALVRGRLDMHAAMHAEGSWWAYQTFVKQLDPLLEAMTAAGMGIDAARVASVTASAEAMMTDTQAAMTAAVPPDVRKTKVWKTAKAAEKGLGLLKEAGEVSQDTTLEPVEAEMETVKCGACGVVGVTKAHVTRKTMEAK